MNDETRETLRGLCWKCGRVTELGTEGTYMSYSDYTYFPDLCSKCQKVAVAPPENYNTAVTEYDQGCTCQPLPEHRIAIALMHVAEQLGALQWWNKE